MKQEMYSNIIGKTVWEKCKDKKVWDDDYKARIEGAKHAPYDRLDIYYDSHLEEGEIKCVKVVWYCITIFNDSGEESINLAELPISEQKIIYDYFMSELPNIK